MPTPEGRAIAVAGLLRQGWTAGAVSAGLRVTDRGGSPQEAMDAMNAAQKATDPNDPSTSPDAKRGTSHRAERESSEKHA